MKARIPTKLGQEVLHRNGSNIEIDGIEGRLTLAAAIDVEPSGARDRAGALTRAVQRIVGASVDGLYGPQTESAVEVWLGLGAWHGRQEPATRRRWPRYRDAAQFFGAPGENLSTLRLPYPMVLAWDTDTVIHRFTCNARVVSSLEIIFKKTLDHYGMEKIYDLGLNKFGGCYSNRTMRGGRRKSVHAYAAAVDLDPLRNPLRAGRKTARLAQPDAEAFWRIVEAEGAVSLGREKNYDWMHFQFVRLG